MSVKTLLVTNGWRSSSKQKTVSDLNFSPLSYTVYNSHVNVIVVVIVLHVQYVLNCFILTTLLMFIGYPSPLNHRYLNLYY